MTTTLHIETETINASKIMRIANALNGKLPDINDTEYLELIKSIHVLIDIAEMRHAKILQVVEKSTGGNSSTYKLVELLQV